jgi:hypothetical protein
MKKFLINYSYAMYLGFTISLLFNARWDDWKYYVVMVPTIILAQWKVNNKED